MIDLDLNQSTIACYHFPSLSELANGHSSLPIPIDETRHYTIKKSAYRGGFEKLKTASIDMNAL
jgi:hypothetical protein